jgi:hypothetical protein
MMAATPRQSLKTLLIAIMAGAILTALAVPGWAFLLTPAHRDLEPRWSHVTRLSSVPDDNVPHLFRVTTPHTDAWTRYPDRVQGYVFLRRPPAASTVYALRAYHHSRFRIPVVYDEELHLFQSTCWLVQFDLDGKLLEPEKLRPLTDDIQSLNVMIQGGEIFVEYDTSPAGGQL